MKIPDITGGERVLSAALLCFTYQGEQLAKGLPDVECRRHGTDLFSTTDITEDLFYQKDVLIFISAAGIAVRAIAGLAADKTRDPAVIVIDDSGRFVIPILSGHLGMANGIAQHLAKRLGAQPVITTASDARAGVEAVDTIAMREGLTITDLRAAKIITAAAVNGEPVRRADYEGGVTVLTTHAGAGAMLTLLPKKYVIGVGCRKGIDGETFSSFVQQAMDEFDIREEEVFRIASIDRKASEPAILSLSRQMHIPFSVFTAAQLNGLKGNFTGSGFVHRTVGTDSVCERSAIAACGSKGGRLILKKRAASGMTLAIAERNFAHEAGGPKI